MRENHARRDIRGAAENSGNSLKKARLVETDRHKGSADFIEDAGFHQGKEL
jgi:hypothetical protein